MPYQVACVVFYQLLSCHFFKDISDGELFDTELNNCLNECKGRESCFIGKLIDMKMEKILCRLAQN